ncbi:MAG: YesL family protein [Defluviitaleaceae bacterium]|nr:YesL family protein [Defluviitaleaceae bacterium]
MNKGFFSADGKFYKVGTVLGDMLFAGVLWIFFSIPLVTIGAATAGVYYACTKKVSGRDEYFFKDFFKGFKSNFVKATLAFLILAAITVVIGVNIGIMNDSDTAGLLDIPVFVAQYFVLIQSVFVAVYVFAILARFELSLIAALKSAMIIANKHLFTTIANVAMLTLTIVASLLFPVLILFIVGAYIYLSSMMFVKIFRKQYPDFDKPLDQTLKPLNFGSDDESED